MTGAPRSEHCETPQSQLRWGRCACAACKSARISAKKIRERERLKKSQGTPEYRVNRAKQKAEKYKCPEHRASILEVNRAWRLRNPGAILAKKARGRAAKRNALPGWFGELDRFVMLEAADLCRLRELVTGFRWQVDHMIPLQAKLACGLHCSANVQVIPAFHNRSKGNKMIFTEPFDWLKAA